MTRSAIPLVVVALRGAFSQVSAEAQPMAEPE